MRYPMYKLSRVWNRLVLTIALVVVKRLFWDFTGENNYLRESAAEPIGYLIKICGTLPTRHKIDKVLWKKATLLAAVRNVPVIDCYLELLNEEGR